MGCHHGRNVASMNHHPSHPFSLVQLVDVHFGSSALILCFANAQNLISKKRGNNWQWQTMSGLLQLLVIPRQLETPSHSPEQRMRIAHTKLQTLSSFCAHFCHRWSIESKCSVISQLWKLLQFSFEHLQTIEEVQEEDNSFDYTCMYVSTPFGCNDDRPFKALYCQPHSHHFIGQCRKRSRNMVTPPRRQHHNYLSMLHLCKCKACATFHMPPLK